MVVATLLRLRLRLRLCHREQKRHRNPLPKQTVHQWVVRRFVPYGIVGSIVFGSVRLSVVQWKCVLSNTENDAFPLG